MDWVFPILILYVWWLWSILECMPLCMHGMPLLPVSHAHGTPGLEYAHGAALDSYSPLGVTRRLGRIQTLDPTCVGFVVAWRQGCRILG